MKSGPHVALRAVLLDAMGTLVRLAPPAGALAAGLLAEHGLVVSEGDAEKAMRAEMTYYRAHHDQGVDEHSLAALRRDCAAVLREALGAAAAQIGLDALTATLLGALRFEAYEDANDALRELRRAGRSAIVVSNWDISLPAVLERVGLAAHLDGVVTSASVGAAKPARAIFLRALELAGVPAEQALHVGDSIAHDVLGARAAGIRAVLLERDASRVPADGDVQRIRSLAEVPALAA